MTVREVRSMMASEPKELLRSALGLGPGETPFPWQEKLLERMLKGDIPELIDIATGLGKTSVIAIWLVARACGANLARRLVYCLPMRVLVEQTRSRAVQWAKNLNLLAGEAEFDERSRLSRYTVDWKNPNKVAVLAMMGGEAQDDWREHPEHPAIIVGTQDMLLSRALNRGFAMEPQLWPVDFGFLNVDALWVMDEVQLMGPGRSTSVQLQHFWDEKPLAYGSRQTVWMSATLGTVSGSCEPPEWMKTPERGDKKLARLPHRYEDADLRHPGFAARWEAPKRLELHLDATGSGEIGTRAGRRRARGSEGASATAAAPWTVESQELVERVLNEAQGGRLVLVFVNQVKRACRLYERLRDKTGSGPEVVLLHARMRPRDRKAWEARLVERLPEQGRIVVATQVLEAGVDIDADALFTELCPWPSLVQRLGRLNRRGTRPSTEDVEKGRPPAPAVVFEPPVPPRNAKEKDKNYQERRKREAALPYEAEALDEARKHLEEVMRSHHGSVSPETLAKLPTALPVEGPVLRRFDLDDLFDTDPDLGGGHSDVSPYIRAVDRDVDAYVLWRRLEGGAPPEDQVPIHPDEICAVPFYEAREAFRNQEVWILTLATGRRRGGAWRRAGGSDIRAGDTVMVDVRAGRYDAKTGWSPDSQRSPREIVDRWTRNEATIVRAWEQVNNGTVSMVEEIDDRIVGVRARGEDPRSFTKHWMQLDLHLRQSGEEAWNLADALKLPDPFKNSLISAARWHDVGKALERNGKRPFQEMLRKAGQPEGGHPKDDVLYAKSNRRGGPPAGFRHELASLIAFFQAGQNDDLAAFLILGHHGKVRLLPEPWDEEHPRDLCGVRAGDRIAPVALPSGVGSGSEPLVLDPDMLFPSPSRPGWQGRVHRLLKDHGPFLLAYLEGLVRVADWRGSQ